MRQEKMGDFWKRKEKGQKEVKEQEIKGGREEQEMWGFKLTTNNIYLEYDSVNWKKKSIALCGVGSDV